MMRFVLITAALLALACSGPNDRAAPEDTSAPAPGSSFAASSQIELTEANIDQLIYWEGLFDAFFSEAPPVSRALVAAMGSSADARYEAFLVDLGFYSTPYQDQALEILLRRKGPFHVDDAIELVESRGFKKPADDSDAYLRFKQHFMGTLVRDFEAFLKPDAPRTISAQEIFWGGVVVDGIPPLNQPRFVSPSEAASWIDPTDSVIGVEIEGAARAYPRRIIDWHEMVNDTVGGVPVSLAYCTLCGSAILYDGRFNGEVYRFGTSGLLYRSNKLMYDTNTRSLWEQYTGEPAWGPLVGQGVRLDILPVVHTTWQAWLAAHPETKVLDIKTGFRRDYGSGVAYADYWASSRLIFPAPNQDGPLKPKDYVYAVRVGEAVTAYPINLLARKGYVQDAIGDRKVVVVATADGSGGRAYELEAVEFVSVAPARDALVSRDGRRWRLTEEALIAEDGRRLQRLPGHNSFWFAVLNHAPGWRLYPE